jgi:putative membrane protein
MKEKILFGRSFNWRMLLMRFVVNLVALTITLLIVPRVNLLIRDLATWLWLALMLGLLNTFIKPIIQVLTLRFIFATTGLVVILINAFILILLSWLFPNYIQASLFWALVGGAVLGLTATFLENLFGLTPPIVSEKYPEIRQRVKDRQFYRTQAELARIEARQTGKALELTTAKAVVVAAAGAVAQKAPNLGQSDAGSEVAMPVAEPVDADGNKVVAAKPEPEPAESPDPRLDGQTAQEA